MATASAPAGVAPGTTQFELVIGGMTCAACAARVQAKLNKLDGVAATVNLATERAHVTAPARVSVPELVSAVEAGLAEPENRQPRRLRVQAEKCCCQSLQSPLPDRAAAGGQMPDRITVIMY